jgi:hypothetical protein
MSTVTALKPEDAARQQSALSPAREALAGHFARIEQLARQIEEAGKPIAALEGLRAEAAGAQGKLDALVAADAAAMAAWAQAGGKGAPPQSSPEREPLGVKLQAIRAQVEAAEAALPAFYGKKNELEAERGVALAEVEDRVLVVLVEVASSFAERRKDAQSLAADLEALMREALSYLMTLPERDGRPAVAYGRLTEALSRNWGIPDSRRTEIRGKWRALHAALKDGNPLAQL